MGDYADMAIDQGVFEAYFVRDFADEALLAELDLDDEREWAESMARTRIIKGPIASHEDYSPKAWKVVFPTGFSAFIPKQYCVIKQNHIYMPWWLARKKELEYRNSLASAATPSAEKEEG
jgi:hypothetical protein